MPRMDGMELLGHLRKASNLPVIFLTSKDDEIDEVLGLRMGADDYITKPFSQRLLIERIRALLRRDQGGEDGGQPGEVAEATLVRGELTLDPARPPIGRAWCRDRVAESVVIAWVGVEYSIKIIT